MDETIAKRTGKMFAASAMDDGKVLSVSDDGILVQYADGTKAGFPLGRQYGKAEGSTYPHDLTTTLKAGDKFESGDVLTYNTKFFEPYLLDPKQVVLKTNRAVRTAFVESPETHEDSAALSLKASELFQVEVTKVRSYVVRFTQNLAEPVKVGEVVEPNTVLMVIEDEMSAGSRQYSDKSLDALKRLSSAAPRAELHGTVERIEVLYHGDKRDMSKSLRKLADASDARLIASAKSTGKPEVTGRVTEEYRVSGTPLELDHAEVRIYLSVKTPSGTGDKLVFGHQMKATIAEVLPYEIHTEDGEPVDALFSHKSPSARGALSIMMLCAYSTLLDALGKRVVKTFFGEK